MKITSISLKSTLDVTMRDTIRRIKELGEKDSQVSREEYKEWIEASEDGTKYSHALYESDESKSKHDH
tara:strand:- start:282 stop:485 length:204 start_codon:yes stop_codon:yes gene_type:complete